VWHDPELHRALFHSLRLALVTTLVAVPLGVAFAIGVDRWHGRLAKGTSFQMLLSFVVPELVLGVALLFGVTSLFRFIPRRTRRLRRLRLGLPAVAGRPLSP
jgi:spermidine/putrescine transport system permease protein